MSSSPSSFLTYADTVPRKRESHSSQVRPHMPTPHTHFLVGGYVPVSAILSHRRGRQHNEEDVRRVVTNCPKSRFALTEISGQLLIRANQGHTLQVTAYLIYS